MPEYQMFVFPSRTAFMDTLIDVDAVLAKKISYLAKVVQSPAVYNKTPADIALLEQRIESLETIQALLLDFKNNALAEPETSEYLIPGSQV